MVDRSVCCTIGFFNLLFLIYFSFLICFQLPFHPSVLLIRPEKFSHSTNSPRRIRCIPRYSFCRLTAPQGSRTASSTCQANFWNTHTHWKWIEATSWTGSGRITSNRCAWSLTSAVGQSPNPLPDLHWGHGDVAAVLQRWTPISGN